MAGASSLAATITVGVALPRSEPSGDSPPVTVMRNRPSPSPLASSTASAAVRSSVDFGTSSPIPDAEYPSRSWWRRHANGTPS